MYIKQLYTNCLAEAAYYIESNGEAAIIDPLRETTPYLELAKERDSKIKYVFETHFHADFVSGHIDLAKATGAAIVYGPTASAEYDVMVAEDMEQFPLGNIHIKVLHTPGHTLESSCFLVVDEHGKEHAVFTGDTLFIGDVGRPDLAVKTDLSREDLARFLYRSINEKLMTLHDDVIVYPGHGAGSQCGKALSDETESTIGQQKQYNYALNVSSEDDFVKQVTEGLNAPPQYFPKNAVINKKGYQSIDVVLEKADTPLTADQFETEKNKEQTLVIDSRASSEFSTGFVPGALNIGLDGFFAVWVGTLVEDLNTPLLLVTEKGMEKDTALRLARVGYENVIGYLDGGFDAWLEAGKTEDTIINMCPVDFKANSNDKSIIDVRNFPEYDAGHVENAKNIPLAALENSLSELNVKDTLHIYCKSGYRSMIASSILKRNGFKNIVNVKKGYDGIANPELTCCCIKTDEK
jgi:hydroxyacylglutathione hydrolase